MKILEGVRGMESERLRRREVEVTALQGTERRARKDGPAARRRELPMEVGQSPLACAGSERAQPRGRPRRGRGHWTTREDLGPGSGNRGVWDVWIRGWGKRLGQKEEVKDRGPSGQGVWQREVSRMGRAPWAGI